MKIRYKIGVAGLAVAALLTVGVLTSASEDPRFKLGRNAEILINMFREINLFYVDPVDSDKMLADAAQGITSNLDPYTEFIAASDVDMFETMTTGKYGGIGSIIRKKGDYIIIDQPYKGFPADKAGLAAGDKIIEIDGTSMKDAPVERVSTLMKGDPGTSFKLKVEKMLTGEVQTITMKRERITISGVPYYGFLSDSVGYIVHSDFTEDCSDDLRKAFMALRGQGRLRGLIIDLRGNGGGILQEAVKILSMFVPKGTQVVSMKGRMKQMSASFKTEHEPIDTKIPIVILTNSGSASASEIVAGAMQDLDRAVLIGQRTFGKGLVQSPRPLGYNAYLKITTARYFIPSGRFIQALDYSHKAEDGSVRSVPDSLIKEYATSGGRKVYDGGGIMPDIRLEPEYLSRFAMIAYRLNYVDEFIDDYMYRNRERVDIGAFRLPDIEYRRFVEFMQDKEMDYQSRTKAALRALRERATEERYLPRIASELDNIEVLLRDDKQADLEMFRDDLTKMIEDEIILRQHYAGGVIQRRSLADKTVARAVELLNNPSEYSSILTDRDTDRK